MYNYKLNYTQIGKPSNERKLALPQFFFSKMLCNAVIFGAQSQCYNLCFGYIPGVLKQNGTAW